MSGPGFVGRLNRLSGPGHVAQTDTGGSGEMAGSVGTLRVVWIIVILLLLRGISWGVEALAVDRPLRIDGILVEWGGAEWVPIAPGGPEVGYRGAFDGPEDHEADLYLMWDAEFLYAYPGIFFAFRTQLAGCK